MNIRFSLFTKILFWFFLNLGVLVFLLIVIFGQQFKVNVDSFFRFDKGARINAVVRLITQDFNRSNRADWDEIIDRFRTAYGVDFLLVSTDTIKQIAGKKISIPNKVLKIIEQFQINRPPNELQPPSDFLKGTHGPPRPPPSFYQAMKPGAPPHMNPPPRFFVRTKNPRLYWFGIEFPIFNEIGAPPKHLTLLIVSEKADGNGLFFDSKPWLFIIVLMMVLSVILWIPLIRNITQPLRKMTLATRQIANGHFNVKLDEARSDEIGQLGGSINEMSARLDGLIKGQKRFLGDVAHELASPIARIQMGLGILEQKTDDDNNKRVIDVLDEVQHMSHLVNELLSFSRAEVNPAKVKLKMLKVAHVVQRVVDREGSENIPIKVSMEEDLQAFADPELLARAISNLIRNAIRYAGSEGPIEIEAGKSDSKVMIVVRDFGQGVPEKYLGQLFEPFYRPDISRGRETGGVGLGLAIVRTCVQTCRGNVTAENLNPRGFAVTIVLHANEKLGQYGKLA